jgi:hypothetical protein
MPCPKCDGFSQRLNILDVSEYLDLTRELIQIVSEGTFLLVAATCPLEDVFQTPMPGDTISHDFQCFACGRRFKLFADSYHGHASWTPGDEPTISKDIRKPS